MISKTRLVAAACLSAMALAGAGTAFAEDAAPPGKANVAVDSDDGIRYYNSDSEPTFKIEADGTVDWPTFSGFRRYHAECHVCHGPDGEGSTYAPALKNSVMHMEYGDFLATIAGGRQKVGASENSVMPAFGTNKNVMCYVDDLWTYLRARGSGDLPRGRPAKRADKSEAYSEAEKACMDG